MENLTLFVADVDQDHIRRTREAIARRRELAFIGSAAHGTMAFRRLMSESADIVLLDLQLPGMDGLTLLRALNRQPRRPICIVCTRFYSSFSVSCAVQNGADYFLYKPLDYSHLPEVLLDCSRTFRPELPVAAPPAQSPQLRQSLTALGFDASHRGTCYLIEGLRLLRQRPELLRNLSRGLYAAIAERMDTTPACVERALRHATANACQRGNLMEIFSHRPTNRELFATLQKLDPEEYLPAPFQKPVDRTNRYGV